MRGGGDCRDSELISGCFYYLIVRLEAKNGCNKHNYVNGSIESFSTVIFTVLGYTTTTTAAAQPKSELYKKPPTDEMTQI